MSALASAALTLDAVRESLAGAELSDATIQALTDVLSRHGDRPRQTIVAAAGASRLDLRATEPSALLLGETLGQGGMGIVRRATQVSLGREVAAKTVRPARENDPEVAAQLMREAFITGMLEHPNIVPVHDIQLDEQRMPVVVLKRIEGDAWDELIAEPARIGDRLYARDPLAWHLRVLIQVCHAVELAHDRGIAHRDLKPENVMIGRFGEVYLVDWGVAAALRDDVDPRVPRPKPTIVGTPSYMAPEMARAAPDLLTERTDVYLLGAVLYELLTGAPPHTGATVIEVVANVMLREPAPIEDTPAELAEICTRAMAKDAAARFATVAALRAALEDHLEHRASASLVDEAGKRLDALETLAADDEADRAALQSLFGPCRFAYVHALSIWPDNPDARHGLDRALVAMARAELTRGEAGAARSLLAEAEVIPEALEREVEGALARERQERAILERIEHERREMDPRVGRRQRITFALVLALFACVGPVAMIVRAGVGAPQQPRELLFWPWVMGAFVAALAWVLRGALLRTKLNRRLMGILIGSMFALGVFHAGAALLSIDLASTQALDFAVYTGSGVICAALVDRRFGLSAAVYGVGFLIASAAPDRRAWVLFAGNVTLVANFLWVWPPWRPEPDEPQGSVRPPPGVE